MSVLRASVISEEQNQLLRHESSLCGLLLARCESQAKGLSCSCKDSTHSGRPVGCCFLLSFFDHKTRNHVVNVFLIKFHVIINKSREWSFRPERELLARVDAYHSPSAWSSVRFSPLTTMRFMAWKLHEMNYLITESKKKAAEKTQKLIFN